MALCRACKRRRIFCSPSTRIQCRPRVYRVDGRTECNSRPESHFASVEIRRDRALGSRASRQLFNSSAKRVARTPLLLALAKRIDPEGCFPKYRKRPWRKCLAPRGHGSSTSWENSESSVSSSTTAAFRSTRHLGASSCTTKHQLLCAKSTSLSGDTSDSSEACLSIRLVDSLIDAFDALLGPFDE